jgi:hypothetical protein
MDEAPQDSPQPESLDHSRAKLLAALIEAHHSTFYTVISVIQATCFGFLVVMCSEGGGTFTRSQWILAATTLAIIVLVWNGFIRGFVILNYVPKLADGVMPFALGATQCFAAYHVAHGVRGWYWSIAALCCIGSLGYVNAEINAKLNPDENAHIMVFYGKQLRILQISSLLCAALCGIIASALSWSDDVLTFLSLPFVFGYAIGDEIMWLRLEKFARGRTS